MKTVLVAEDDPGLRETYVDFLSERYNIVSASNGAQALEKLASGSIDAVLMDVEMPVMDGITTLRRIREQSRHKPVIIMSGKELDWMYDKDTNTTLTQALEQAGATDFFSKDKDINYLRQLFEKYLN